MHQVDKLGMMANQIALFFKSYPHDEAVAGVATHIRAFWTPKMCGVLRDKRYEIFGLDPIVIEAFSPEEDARDPGLRAKSAPGSREGGDDAG
jgi:formate dehydrogenase subunit delta